MPRSPDFVVPQENSFAWAPEGEVFGVTPRGVHFCRDRFGTHGRSISVNGGCLRHVADWFSGAGFELTHRDAIRALQVDETTTLNTWSYVEAMFAMGSGDHICRSFCVAFATDPFEAYSYGCNTDGEDDRYAQFET